MCWYWNTISLQPRKTKSLQWIWKVELVITSSNPCLFPSWKVHRVHMVDPFYPFFLRASPPKKNSLDRNRMTNWGGRIWQGVSSRGGSGINRIKRRGKNWSDRRPMEIGGYAKWKPLQVELIFSSSSSSTSSFAATRWSPSAIDREFSRRKKISIFSVGGEGVLPGIVCPV